LVLGAIVPGISSCSTTKSLSEGEYRLVKNSIEVTNNKEFDVSGLNGYIKQAPNNGIFGWNPFLSIYNIPDIDDQRALARFARKIGVAPVVLDTDAVDESVQNIKNHLEYLGYYDSGVSASIDCKGKKANVKYDIELGNRYLIDSLVFNLPDDDQFVGDFYSDVTNMLVKPGEYLSEELLEKESQRGAKRFRDMSYFGFSKDLYSFEADTISKPGRLLLALNFKSYDGSDYTKRFLMDSVSISYPKELKFREDVLLRLNTLKPGDPYSESSVNNTYSRLSSLRVFSSVGIDVNQTDSSKVNCSINLSPSRIQGFKANVEASTNSNGLFGISPQLSYYHKNIFHGGEWLNLSFLGNFQFKNDGITKSNEYGVSASLSFPRFLGIPISAFKGGRIPRTEIAASYNYQFRPEYVRATTSASYTYSGILGNLTNYQLSPLRLSVINLDAMDEAFSELLQKNPLLKSSYQDHFDLGISGSIYYSTSTEAVPSGSYSYARFTADMSGTLISLLDPVLASSEDGTKMIFNVPYSQYVKGELTLGRTWVFGRKSGQAIATRIIAGLGMSYGNSDAMPFEKLFYCGGANSMRGWQSRSLGPGYSELDNTMVIPSQAGNLKFEANLEYRFNLFWKLAAAAFVDVGNVWTVGVDKNVSNFDFGSIAADGGLGMRLNLNVLVLRLDMGVKLYEPSRPTDERWLSPEQWLKRDGFAVHFGVGYPF